MIRQLRPGQLVFDVVTAGVVFLVAVLPAAGLDPMAVVTLFGLCVALVFRRWVPIASLSIAWAVALIEMASAQPPSFANVLILGVLYACSLYGDALVRWAAFVSAFVGAALVASYLFFLPAVIGWPMPGTVPFASVMINGAVSFGAALSGFLLAWTLGLLVRTWRRGRDSRRQATQAEREVVAEQERTRIARDMHDVVAHSLAVVIAQADGARYLRSTDPAAVDEALTTIAATSREALADVRVLLAQLRHSQGDAPQPVLADLERLYEQIRASGLDIVNESSGDRLPLGTSTQLAVYRIVQESLTNALRHGDAEGEVVVRFDWAPGGLHLSIASGLRQPGVATTGPVGGGHGVVGMTERALLVGGTLSATAVGARWVVRAWLPADRTGSLQVMTGPIEGQVAQPAARQAAPEPTQQPTLSPGVPS